MKRMSNNGLALLKRFEGLRTTAYKDAAGVWTIGYGSTGGHVREGLTISESDAERLLMRDLERFEDCINRLVRVPLSQNQFDALVSFAFNLGCGALARKNFTSTLLSRLNDGDYDGAAQAFLLYNKARSPATGELRAFTRNALGRWSGR